MPNSDRRATARPSGQPSLDPLLVYETLFRQSSLCITVFDRDLVVRDASCAAAKQAGRTRESMCGVRLSDYLPPEYVSESVRTLAGETVVCEHKLSPESCGAEAHVRGHLLPLRDAAGAVCGGVTIVADVSEHKRAEALVERLAFVDPLTELPNRRMLEVTLARALSGARAKRRPLALVWLNVDRFRDVNDALGRQAGDALLRAIGQRLVEVVRANDLVAHVGGDDFILLLPRINSPRHLERLMDRVHSVFEAPFIVDSESVLMTSSCGIAVHPDGSCPHELEEHAHVAMRTAKELGGGACRMYESELSEDSAHRLRLVSEIRDGIDAGHFVLHFQPQVDLQTMRVDVVEALARWEHPERGLLPPAEFIPIAEETAMIVPLGRHLLGRASSHHREWRDALPAAPRVAVNVSAREVQRTDVCGEVRRAAAAAGIPTSALEVEITETAVLADPRRAAEVTGALRADGATVALDDFGTGYSSLTHLRELPIDRVKIERSFVAGCLTDRSAAAILVGVTHIAHDLDIKVVAEGVETQSQLEFLRAVGCDAVQGYHVARPLPPDECMDFLLRSGEELAL
jgi:diguanylate cyclase (GGDEF)-like protein/PAS domain S-box-containing protein